MKWRPIDFIVLIIILAISLALISVMLKPLITGQPNGPGVIQAAHDLLAALIAIVAVYVGSNLDQLYTGNKKKHDNNA